MTAQILKWEDGNRRLARRCEPRLAVDARRPVELQAISTNGAGDILQRLLAHIVEHKVDLASYIFLHAGRDANSTRLGDAFKTCGDVNAVTENVAVLLHNVADINSDAKQNPAVLGFPDVAASHFSLNCDSATHSVDRTCELDEKPVTRRLDDSPAVTGDTRIQHITTMRGQPRQRPFFVDFHQSTVASHIGGKDCRKLPLHMAHCQRSPPREVGTIRYLWRGRETAGKGRKAGRRSAAVFSRDAA
jgi:hypothetical protein